VTVLTTIYYQVYKREEMLKVYSKNNCPFCDKAKHLLETKGISFSEVKIDQDSEAREWLMAQGHRTVPQLYLGESLLVEGGYQGLAKLSDEELTARLAGA
jgi:glutaredoxin 3